MKDRDNTSYSSRGLKSRIKDFFYDLSVKLSRKKKKNGKKMGTKARGDLIFYLCLVAVPLIQFCIMYIGVNANSIILAFKEYDIITGDYSFAGFKNFIEVFQTLAQPRMLASVVKNSLLFFVLSTCITIPLSLLFSYYIYKQMPGHAVFKVILYMPSIISSIIMVIVFNYFVERAIPEMVYQMFGIRINGLLSNLDTTFGTIVFYNIFYGLGGNILLYTGSMNNISESVVEAGKLDGTTAIKEFWYITLPMIFPTLSVFLVTGVAGIALADMQLFSFFEDYADFSVQTFGYYLFTGVKTAAVHRYPFYAAFGIILTIIVVPIVLLVRKLLTKYGPSVE